jgi:hypothetical protein
VTGCSRLRSQTFEERLGIAMTDAVLDALLPDRWQLPLGPAP